MNDHLTAKKLLRAEIRARLENLSPAQRELGSAAACSRLQEKDAWCHAETILFYSPIANELNVSPLLEIAFEQRKTVLLPRFDPSTDKYVICQIKDPALDLTTGKFGILEPGPHSKPFQLNNLDLALVPGVGFDEHGGRLGRGRGFYDRLLAEIAGTKCGVAFDEQMVAEVPIQPHDMKMSLIVTPTRWISAAEQS